MAEDIATAVKRYWAVITAIVVAMIFAGNIYLGVLEEIDILRSDLRDYITERAGLLRDINGRFDRIEKRIDRLEQP